MESKTEINDIPTALPGFEDEDAREKLLLETSTTESDIEPDDDDGVADLVDEKGRSKKRRWQVMRTVIGFGVFVGILVLVVSWFFRLGWFAESKAQPVSRNSKDALVPSATEDEKLKMALSMVAANGSKTTETSGARIDPEGTSSTPTPPVNGSVSLVGDLPVESGPPIKVSPGAGESQYALAPSSDITPTQKQSGPEASKQVAEKKAAPYVEISRTDSSVDAPGRSLFFGVTRKPLPQAPPERILENSVPAVPVNGAPRRGIPFGALLPVRLVGSMYTLKNSSGVVRMELTRGVEGNGYSYPAGTVVVGNARGGESSRAFVTIIGLIDPVSGELVKFSGELLGKDGASGIEGKRRRLTSQWAHFFNGLKETASSVLGSVGAIRSGSTVILSEPIRKGSGSVSEDFSNAFLGSGKDDTFIEVSAGANGYVLVTDLPGASPSTTDKLKAEAAEK